MDNKALHLIFLLRGWSPLFSKISSRTDADAEGTWSAGGIEVQQPLYIEAHTRHLIVQCLSMRYLMYIEAYVRHLIVQCLRYLMHIEAHTRHVIVPTMPEHEVPYVH